MAYSKNLEDIIDAALADGELTEKERAVLHKKAEQEGVDLDELDVVIDGRLAKMKKQEDWLRPTPPSKEKLGNIVTCPACGAIVPAGAAVCPECGYEFRNVAANATITKLSKRLEEIEAQRGGGMQENQLFLYMTGTISKVDQQKIQCIKGFPIPNTKADMLEFLAYAIPEATRKIDYTGEDAGQGMAPAKYKQAWTKKCQEVILQAERTLSKDKEAMDEINRYKAMLGKKKFLSKHVIGTLVSLLMILLPIIVLSYFAAEEKEEKAQVETAIRNQADSLSKVIMTLPIPDKNNYKECTNKIQQVTWTPISCTTGSYSRELEKLQLQMVKSFVTKKNAYIEQINSLHKMDPLKEDSYENYVSESYTAESDTI